MNQKIMKIIKISTLTTTESPNQSLYTFNEKGDYLPPTKSMNIGEIYRNCDKDIFYKITGSN